MPRPSTSPGTCQVPGGADSNVPCPLPVGSIGGERRTWPVAGGPARASECDGGAVEPGPRGGAAPVPCPLSSPVDSEGGERGTWPGGRWWPTLCAFVCPWESSWDRGTHARTTRGQ